MRLAPRGEWGASSYGRDPQDTGTWRAPQVGRLNYRQPLHSFVHGKRYPPMIRWPAETRSSSRHLRGVSQTIVPVRPDCAPDGKFSGSG
jgi:hypothetical protein